jgi:hypothetical protein
MPIQRAIVVLLILCSGGRVKRIELILGLSRHPRSNTIAVDFHPQKKFLNVRGREA